MPAPLSLVQSIFKKCFLSAYYMLGSVNKTLSKKKKKKTTLFSRKVYCVKTHSLSGARP